MDKEFHYRGDREWEKPTDRIFIVEQSKGITSYNHDDALRGTISGEEVCCHKKTNEWNKNGEARTTIEDKSAER